jgi:hypothetical protein
MVVVVAVLAVVVVVSGAVVVTAVVDAPVVSTEVEVVAAVEVVSASRAENGSPSASAPDAITPSNSNATSAAVSFANPDFLDLLVRFSTVFLPISLPQFLLDLPLVRPLPAIADPFLRHGDLRRRHAKGSLSGRRPRLVACASPN